MHKLIFSTEAQEGLVDSNTPHGMPDITEIEFQSQDDVTTHGPTDITKFEVQTAV